MGIKVEFVMVVETRQKIVPSKELNEKKWLETAPSLAADFERLRGWIAEMLTFGGTYVAEY